MDGIKRERRKKKKELHAIKHKEFSSIPLFINCYLTTTTKIVWMVAIDFGIGFCKAALCTSSIVCFLQAYQIFNALFKSKSNMVT